MDVIKKQKDLLNFEVENYADYELIDSATSAIDSLECDVAYKVEQSGEPENHTGDLKGLMSMARIVDRFKNDGDQFIEGLDDGREQVRMELNPMIRELLRELESYIDSNEPDEVQAYQIGDFTFKEIEERIKNTEE